MENNKENYQIEYSQFTSDYKTEQKSGIEVGEFITRMAQFFIEKNEEATLSEIALSKVAAGVVQQTDENTNKQISVAKAEIIIKATEESATFKKAKMHAENVENLINALKFLQRALLTEAGIAGGM